MNARLLFCMVAASCALVALAIPEIREGSVTMTQADDRTVTISYTLDGAPAIVTVDILTNGVPLTGALLKGRLTGDFNRKVAPGAHAVTWNPSLDQRLAGDRRWTDCAKAVVTAWPTNAPPTWMVVDLRVANSIEFYPDESWFPEPVTSDIYKTDLLVMRKIPAANVIWRIGSPNPVSHSDYMEYGRQADGASPNEIAHPVMLTEDYYIGVFEVTQGQYKHLKSLPTVSWTGDTLPVGNVRWCQELRGSCPAYFWPTEGHKVDSTKFLGLLRAHACNIEFDLPTEAQWEIACRAGEMAAFNNGTTLHTNTVGVAEVAWTPDNAAEGYEAPQVHPVGLKKPNRWGLYDMHGNVVEWCLDLYASNVPDISDEDEKAAHVAYAQCRELMVDPVGPTTSSDKGRTDGGERSVAKGGSYSLDASYARSARRYNPNRWGAGQASGFRLCCPACIP